MGCRHCLLLVSLALLTAGSARGRAVFPPYSQDIGAAKIKAFCEGDPVLEFVGAGWETPWQAQMTFAVNVTVKDCPTLPATEECLTQRRQKAKAMAALTKPFTRQAPSVRGDFPYKFVLNVFFRGRRYSGTPPYNTVEYAAFLDSFLQGNRYYVQMIDKLPPIVPVGRAFTLVFKPWMMQLDYRDDYSIYNHTASPALTVISELLSVNRRNYSPTMVVTAYEACPAAGCQTG